MGFRSDGCVAERISNSDSRFIFNLLFRSCVNIPRYLWNIGAMCWMYIVNMAIYGRVVVYLVINGGKKQYETPR